MINYHHHETSKTTTTMTTKAFEFKKRIQNKKRNLFFVNEFQQQLNNIYKNINKDDDHNDRIKE
jgi:hypothetical protein